MKKLALVLVMAIGLGGCGPQLEALKATVSLGTASIANPITKVREAQIEAGFDAAVQLMLAYRRACIKGAADVHCLANIEMIQPYTRQAQTILIPQLRKFVNANDQLNAVVIFNQLTSLYSEMKSEAAKVGVNVGSLT